VPADKKTDAMVVGSAKSYRAAGVGDETIGLLFGNRKRQKRKKKAEILKAETGDRKSEIGKTISVQQKLLGWDF
jgi:hypothetical protein